MRSASRYLVTLFAAASLNAQAPATARLACEDIARIDWGGAEVSSAVSTSDGPLQMPGRPGSPQTNLQLSAHCLVRATADPRTRAGGKTFGIGFELRMPEKWNGRFMFQDGGGTDVAVRPAVGMAGRGDIHAASFRRLEHLTYLECQGIRTERLGDEAHTRFQHPVLGDHVVRVPSSEFRRFL